MRMLRVWHGDAFRIGLLVSEGDKFAHLLSMARDLDHIKIPRAELARQMRAGLAGEVSAPRGLIGRIEAKRKALRGHNARFSETFVDEALAALRAERSAA